MPLLMSNSWGLVGELECRECSMTSRDKASRATWTHTQCRFVKQHGEMAKSSSQAEFRQSAMSKVCFLQRIQQFHKPTVPLSHSCTCYSIRCTDVLLKSERPLVCSFWSTYVSEDFCMCHACQKLAEKRSEL